MMILHWWAHHVSGVWHFGWYLGGAISEKGLRLAMSVSLRACSIVALQLAAASVAYCLQSGCFPWCDRLVTSL